MFVPALWHHNVVTLRPEEYGDEGSPPSCGDNGWSISVNVSGGGRRGEK